METARTVADAFGLLAGTVVKGGCADCRGQRVGDGKIRGGDAAEGASCAGDFGHHGAAAGQPVDGVAVGDQVGCAGYGHCGMAEPVMVTQVSGELDRGILRRIDVVNGFHACRSRAGFGGIGTADDGVDIEIPHVGKRDDFRCVTAHDGWGSGFEPGENGGSCGSDAGGDRVQHPRMLHLVESVGDLREGILEERKECTHVDISGAGDGGRVDHVVRQEAHGCGSAGCQLRVGDQVDGHEVREGLRERSGVAYSRGCCFDPVAQVIDMRLGCTGL